MKITLENKQGNKIWSCTMQNWAKVALSVCLLGVPLSAGVMLGVELAGGRFGLYIDDSLSDVKQNLKQQKKALLQSRQIAEKQVQSLTVKMAEMQARLVRLDALGNRLSTMADIDKGEFDFTAQPALGGPESYQQDLQSVPSLLASYEHLAVSLHHSEDQLLLLESLYQDNDYSAKNSVSGRPIKTGWLSSRYGYRTDPFVGKRTWHNGVDFASTAGSDVVAVGSGMVTRSEAKSGYGMLVEIDHGEGYVTRYAHNKTNFVKPGELVAKGQVIASVGSTGRSTGPHVHFEVYKHGRSVDPSAYIRRNIR